MRRCHEISRQASLFLNEYANILKAQGNHARADAVGACAKGAGNVFSRGAYLMPRKEVEKLVAAWISGNERQIFATINWDTTSVDAMHFGFILAEALAKDPQRATAVRDLLGDFITLVTGNWLSNLPRAVETTQ